MVAETSRERSAIVGEQLMKNDRDAGSQAQEREALALTLYQSDYDPVGEGQVAFWESASEFVRAAYRRRAAAAIAAGWTRRPSGAGIAELANDLLIALRRVGWKASLGETKVQDAMAKLEAALRGDAETDAPAAAEPQAGAELSVLLERARDWWDSATPEQREQMKREQAENWVRAEMAWGDEGTRMMPTPDTPAPASAPAVGGEALEGALDDLQRVSRRLRGRDITAKIAADLLESIRSRIVLATCPPPPRADAAADDVAALREALTRKAALAEALIAKGVVSINGGLLTDDVAVGDAALASTQRKEGRGWNAEP